MTPRGRGTSAGAGFAIVYLAVAIVVIGIVGAALARISMSSASSSVQLQQLNTARYLAESGVEYARGVAAYEKSQGKSISHIVNTLNANAGKIEVGGVGSFVLTASESGSSIVVSSTGYAKSGLASYALPNLVNIAYGSNASTNDALKGLYSGVSANLTGGGNFDGNYATTTATVDGGATITGSLINLNTSATCLDVRGGVKVGTPGAGNYLCSNTCVVISGGTTVNGNVYAQGDVTFQSGGGGPINGDIYAMGKVLIAGGSVVNGNVYAQGDVTISSGSVVNGGVYSGGNVFLDWPGSFGTDVTGDIYAVGTVTTAGGNASRFYKGHYTRLPSSASIPKPNMCTSYTLPPHETVAPTTQFNFASWPEERTQYTFYGKPDIGDHSYALSSFTLPPGMKICFDLTAPNTYINIFVAGDMNIDGKLYVRTSTATKCFDDANQVFKTRTDLGEAKRVYMDVKGTVNVDGGTGWFGTIYAGGDLNLTGSFGFTYAGALYTNQRFTPHNGGGIDTVYVGSDYVDKYWP